MPGVIPVSVMLPAESGFCAADVYAKSVSGGSSVCSDSSDIGTMGTSSKVLAPRPNAREQAACNTSHNHLDRWH